MNRAMNNHNYNAQAYPQVACCRRGFNVVAFTVFN